MINLNEIAFIDTEGFDYNDGECLVRFDTVMYCPDKKLITFAVTKQGRISVLDYQVFEDDRGHYIEYGNTYEKIYIMNKPIIDLQELLEEVQDMIEEKIAIEGGNQNEW